MSVSATESCYKGKIIKTGSLIINRKVSNFPMRMIYGSEISPILCILNLFITNDYIKVDT